MESGRRYFDSKEFREILKRYEQMKSENSCSYLDADELYDLLLYFLYYERANEANNIYDIACKLHSTDTELLAKIEIRILLSSGNPDAALKKLDAITYSDDLETLILRAEVFLALKDYKAASDIARRLLQQRDLQNEEVYDAISIMLDCGATQEALQIVEEKLENAPKQQELLEAKAECLIEMRQTEEAIELYNKLLDKDPFYIVYWEQLGRIYYMLERYGKALECFEYELTIDDKVDYAKMMQGHCYYKLHDYERTIAVFEELEKKFSNDTMSKFYIALSYSKQKEHTKAIEKFREVEMLAAGNKGNIDYTLAVLNQALICHEVGLEELAISRTYDAIKDFPEYEFRQLMLKSTSLFELRDKDNLTYSDLDCIDAKEWNKGEALYSCALSLFGQGVHNIALLVFIAAKDYVEEHKHDGTEIDAHIAYILHTRKYEMDITPYVTEALNGKSNKLFELFGIPYKANILPQEFMQLIK